MTWSLTVKTESCDEYGPWLFDEKPSDDQIEALLREDCPCEWPDPGDDNEGPGFRGSYCHITLVDCGTPKRLIRAKPIRRRR